MLRFYMLVLSLHSLFSLREGKAREGKALSQLNFNLRNDADAGAGVSANHTLMTSVVIDGPCLPFPPPFV